MRSAPRAMNPHRDRSAWLYGPETPCRIRPPALAHPRRLILLGAPGVGKGTQADLLAAAYGSCHLSTGDIFRSLHTNCSVPLSPAMVSAVDQMREGHLVADDTVLALVKERLCCLGCRGGFLLDGFPRTVVQAEGLDVVLADHGIKLDAVVHYDLPSATILARLEGRRVCPGCHSVFNTLAKPPRTEGVCDRCGTALAQRDDDRPAAAAVRLAAYEKVTAPLIEYYWAQGVLVNVSAEGTPEEIFERTVQQLA